MIAWIFPGQGSQFVGMGAALEGEPARETFATARDVLGWDLRAACLHGPDELLRSTDVAQSAILTVSVAAGRTLQAAGIFPEMVAGHSVGEFAALVAAAGLSFEDALRVVIARANAMARAGRERPGRMTAVIGVPFETVERCCARTAGTVGIASMNGADQFVVSGEPATVDAATAAAREAGARLVQLDVTVAAHSPLMEGAAAELRGALAATTLLPPLVPFASCVSARFHHEPAEISGLFCDALTRPVRWAETVSAMGDAGATAFYEVGPGRVLSGLVRRILPAARVAAFGDGNIEAFLRPTAQGAGA